MQSVKIHFMRKIVIIMAAACCFLAPSFAQDDVQQAAAEAAAALLEAPEAKEEVDKPNYWTNSFQVDLGFRAGRPADTTP